MLLLPSHSDIVDVLCIMMSMLYCSDKHSANVYDTDPGVPSLPTISEVLQNGTSFEENLTTVCDF